MPVKSVRRSNSVGGKLSAAKAGKKRMLMSDPIVEAPVSPQAPSIKKHCCPCENFGKKLLMTLVGILVVYVAIYVGVLTRNELREYSYIGFEDKVERTIFVEAKAEVDVVPDVANITMGVFSENDTVSLAQEENTKMMNGLLERLKALGIPEEDIQTSYYDIYPTYDWSQEDGSELSGYGVSQKVTVKMKDVLMADKVVALAGELEINDVGQLTYSVDERDAYVEQARKEALEKVAKKARVLSQALGVQMVGIVSYDEYELGNSNMYKYDYPYAMEESLHGGGAVPDLEVGIEKVGLNVSVTFEIR